jgi:hypothetical protein
MEILSRMKTNLEGIKLPTPAAKTAYGDAALTREERELRKAISFALAEWKCAELNFETADSPELVEHYTYKLKAYEVKYQYLIKQLKNIMKDEPKIS